MTGRKAAKKPPPDEWASRDLVVLEGGGRDGAWYFADDWAEQCRANERMDQPTVYRLTSKVIAHPQYDIAGTVWRFDPKAAAEVGRRQAEAGIERAKWARRVQHDRAVDLIRGYAQRHARLSINDLRDEFDEAGVDERVRGGAFQAAAARGWIESETWVPSTGASAHGKHITVYRSLIFVPERASA